MNPQERQQLIESRKQDTGRKERLWVRDAWRDFDVWQVPVEALLLNVDNRRFAAERTLIEERLGHELDPENSPEDEQALEVILLDTGIEVEGDTVGGKAGKDYRALRSDWLRRRQETALWIRPDGLVRNGNRRLAMLMRLQHEEGLEGFEYVDAIILDSAEIDEVAVFEMEQREQLTENLKVRYTDINLLLAIRDAASAREIDWHDATDVERVAGELQHLIGNNQSYAVVQLNAIKYMDAYLEDSGQARQYHKLIGQIERFRDVGRAMAQIDVEYPDDATDMLRLLFAAIRAGMSHGIIRKLRRMFRLDRERYRNLLTQTEAIEEESGSGGDVGQIADPEIVIHPGDLDLEDDDDEVEPPGPNVPNYPKARIAEAIEDALDGFEASLTDDVVKILQQVSNRLEILTDERNRLARAFQTPDAERVRAALRGVLEWADQQRHLLSQP